MWWGEIVKRMFVIVVGEKMVKKIMIVDDNPDILLSIKNGLEDSAEYKVIGAESGERCLEILEDEMPDLILLDIMMPEMSGWETYDEIKGNDTWGKIPIVFLTARTDKIARDAGDFLGEDYIEKPFEISNVQERIDKILGR